MNLNDIIQLKDEVWCVLGEMVEMRTKIRSMLSKIYDGIKILALLCVVIFVVCIVMLGVLKWFCCYVLGFVMYFTELWCNFPFIESSVVECYGIMLS